MNPVREPAIQLLPLTKAHLGLVCRLYRDPETMRHLGGPRDEANALALSQQVISLSLQANASQRFWIARDPASSLDLGMGGLERAGASQVELGLLLLGEHQSRGYGRAIIGSLRSKAAGFAPGARVVARHRPGNEAMARLLASNGFEMEGSPCGEHLLWRDSGATHPQKGAG